MMIQLQYLDEKTNKNLGGLYVKPEDISAVRKSKTGSSIITLRCGKEFLIPYSVSDFLETLDLVKRR